MAAWMLAVALLIAPRPVTAQGTSGAFPDPISSAQLERYAQALALDRAATAELVEAHGLYRARMKELREGAIEAWLRDHGRAGGSRAGSADRAAAEDAARRRRQILGQMESVERELFDRLALLAGDGKAAEIARARLRAERERARGTLGLLAGGVVQFELAELLDGEPIDEAGRAAVEEIVAEHERRQTRLLVDLAQRSLRQRIDIAEAMAASGLVAPTGDDPEQTERWFRESSRIRREATRPQSELRAQLGALHRETIVRIRAVVDPAVGDAIFDRFVQRAHGSVHRDPRPVERAFDAAQTLAREQGDEAARDAIAQEHRRWRAARDAATLELVDETESFRGQGDLLAFGADPELLERHERRIRTLADQRRSIDDAAIESAGRLLGPEGAALLAERTGPRRDEGLFRAAEGGLIIADGEGMIDAIVADGEGMMVVAAEFDGGFGPRGGSGALPPELPAAELVSMADRLALDAGARAVVAMLHEDYRSAYEQARQEAQDAIGPGGQGPAMLARAAAGGGAAPAAPDEQAMNRRFAATSAGLARLAAIDGAFFDDLESTLGGAVAPERIRLERTRREREALRHGAGRSGFGPMPGGGREAEVELIQVAAEALPPDAAEAVRASLLAWDAQATALARERRETRLAAQREIDRFMAAATRVEDDGRIDVRIDSDMEGFESFTDAQGRLARANRTLAELNRRSRDEIAEQLDEPLRPVFRRAYAASAWPSIYRDAQDARPKLEAALALEDLDEAQRSAVAALLAEHAERFEAICTRMVEIEERSDPTLLVEGPPDRERIVAMQTRQNDLRKLRFERTESHAEALRRLGTILAPAQVEAIGGVALPESRRAPAFLEIHRAG